MYLYSVDLWMKLCALGDREEKSERERERERKRERKEIKGIRRERKKNLEFLQGGCSAAATTVVFQTLEFPPGRRSHHAPQFALRYKLGDRLYPDYGVTRYRARFPNTVAHTMTTLTRDIVECGPLLHGDHACAWVIFIHDIYIYIYMYIYMYACVQNTPQGLAAVA